MENVILKYEKKDLDVLPTAAGYAARYEKKCGPGRVNAQLEVMHWYGREITFRLYHTPKGVVTVEIESKPFVAEQQEDRVLQ